MPLDDTTLGDFLLLEKLGLGRMGTVYKARQVSLDRIVAVKMILGGLATKEFVQRFRTEASTAASLRHPNIVQVYDVGELDGRPYFTMEYVEGGSLRPLIGRMALAQIGGVLEGLLGGVKRRLGLGQQRADRARIDPLDRLGQIA